ncbi:MAG: chorismate synthase [Candidatus Gastranaerophilales bacterium]|nr:chorismate synthase [Candidatus Gastranaerophilales bacterium]
MDTKLFRFLTSGESHGQALNAIIEGLPAGFSIDKSFIDNELARRQKGYGRGGRMAIEADKVEILSGVRFGKSIGSPISLEVKNKDWANWTIPMSVEAVEQTSENIELIENKKITKVRPGHADLSGVIKYNQEDVRNILERSSARETTMRVAVGAVAKSLLKEFSINAFSLVTQIGEAKLDSVTYSLENLKKAENSDVRCYDDNIAQTMKSEIDKAKEVGDTLGGSFDVIFKGLPVGLGSHVHWDRKLDGLLAQAVMSIPAVKSVEFGMGKAVAKHSGFNTHDEIFYEDGKYVRKTNNAGGIEGGMTNGEDLVMHVSMKAIPTMKRPLKSVDIKNHQAYEAHFERSDTCAVPACAVVAEAMSAIVLADAFLQKFGSDNFEQIKRNYASYQEMLAER